MNFADGQRRTCRRQIFCLPSANETFADCKCLAGRRQNSYRINGKCKKSNRQISSSIYTSRTTGERDGCRRRISCRLAAHSPARSPCNCTRYRTHIPCRHRRLSVRTGAGLCAYLPSTLSRIDFSRRAALSVLKQLHIGHSSSGTEVFLPFLNFRILRSIC